MKLQGAPINQEGGTMRRPVQSGATGLGAGVDPYGPVRLSSPALDKANARWGFAALITGGKV